MCLLDCMDIIRHADDGYCPKGKFGTAERREGYPPADGDCVAPAPMPSVPKQPIPRNKWPLHIKVIAVFRSSSDTGIGDTIERCAGTAGRSFKDWYKEKTGKPCGCDGRKDAFNFLYPY